MIKSMAERIHTGDLYYPNDKTIRAEQLKCLEKLYDYNMTRPSEEQKREELLREMLAEVGEGCCIEPPFQASWGGRNVHFGKAVRAGFNLTLMDDTHIYVGDNTVFGPNVTILTASLPILAELREKYQFNSPVRIGKNCWIAAGAMILPGITIGDNTVVGAGSLVTKDLPPNVIAVGRPCKVMRWITQRDSEFYFKGKRLNWMAVDADEANKEPQPSEENL